MQSIDLAGDDAVRADARDRDAHPLREARQDRARHHRERRRPVVRGAGRQLRREVRRSRSCSSRRTPSRPRRARRSRRSAGSRAPGSTSSGRRASSRRRSASSSRASGASSASAAPSRSPTRSRWRATRTARSAGASSTPATGSSSRAPAGRSTRSRRRRCRRRARTARSSCSTTPHGDAAVRAAVPARHPARLQHRPGDRGLQSRLDHRERQRDLGRPAGSHRRACWRSSRSGPPTPRRTREPSRASRPPARRPRGHARRRPPAHGRVDAALRAAAAQPDREAHPRPARRSPGAHRGRARGRAADRARPRRRDPRPRGRAGHDDARVGHRRRRRRATPPARTDDRAPRLGRCARLPMASPRFPPASTAARCRARSPSAATRPSCATTCASARACSSSARSGTCASAARRSTSSCATSDGALPCSMWRTDFDALRLGEGALGDGAQVVVGGGLDYYVGSRTSSPAFSFAVTRLRVAGEGDLLAQLDRLRKTLDAEGLFEPQKQLAAPGAAADDRRRHRRGRQGARRRPRRPAPPRLGGADRVGLRAGAGPPRRAARSPRALQDLAATGEVDVIVVARGGGSLADLFCFCDETLCRTVALLGVPVIASVGHHTDRTLIDDVAALSCSTPTHAAESAVPVHCTQARADVVRIARRLGVHGRRAAAAARRRRGRAPPRASTAARAARAPRGHRGRAAPRNRTAAARCCIARRRSPGCRARPASTSPASARGCTRACARSAPSGRRRLDGERARIARRALVLDRKAQAAALDARRATRPARARAGARRARPRAHARARLRARHRPRRASS